MNPMNRLNNPFPSNLRWWRLKVGLSTKLAAGKLGVSSSAWSQWEREQRVPSIRYLLLIACALRIPACALLSADPSVCADCERINSNFQS